MPSRNLRLRYVLGSPVLALIAAVCAAPAFAQTQVVYLNFDRVNPILDRDFSTDERNEIQSLMEEDYAQFDFQFMQTAPSSGDYSTLFFNDGPAFGIADGIDFGNGNRNDRARIQVTSGEVFAEDFVAFSANVASHELGHILGLRHYDSLGPIGNGFSNDPDFLFGARGEIPSYFGPTEADEAVFHIMETGITQNMATFPPQKYFGPREAIKLAFNETGTTLLEPSLSPVTGSPFVQTPRQIEFYDLEVPNTVERGPLVRQIFDVEAVVVKGTIGAALQRDYFAFEGNAGDLINIEVFSQFLGPALLGGNGRYTEEIDPQLAVFNSNGDLVDYFGQPARSDDEFEGSLDSFILDLILPADDTYYVEVRSFSSFDVGSYELFMHRFESRATPVGDFNFDGVVDAADYTLWKDTEGDDVTPGTGADTDGNGKIDDIDFAQWASNFGSTASELIVTPAHMMAGVGPSGESLVGPAMLAVSSVPEPTTAGLALLALGGLALRRR